MDFAQLISSTPGPAAKPVIPARRGAPASRRRSSIGRPRPRPSIEHVLHRAAESHHEDEYAEVHSADERFFGRGSSLEHAVALHFMHYNFCRPHQTLTKKAGKKTTPAMAAGITRAPWSLTQLAELLD